MGNLRESEKRDVSTKRPNGFARCLESTVYSSCDIKIEATDRSDAHSIGRFIRARSDTHKSKLVGGLLTCGQRRSGVFG